ncbi:MAG: iron ABC transporter permease [Chloroflexi bacterium]|nr:iron ABC transporter permease [Chloroflexota bacterium]
MLSAPANLRVLGWSLYQATLSTALTLLVGLPAAWAFARFRFAAQPLWRALATAPFVLPTVVVAAAFIALLGPALIGTLGAILLAHVFYNVSVVIRVVGAWWSSVDPQIEEAALVDGADAWARLRWVTLPLALPSIVAAAALIFLFTFSSFGVVLMLGGMQHATLEVSIYRQTAQLLRLDVAASLALLQMLVTLLLGALSTHLQNDALQENSGLDLRRAPRRPAEYALTFAVRAGITLLIGLPLTALVHRSLAADGDPLRYYAALSANVRGSFFFVPPSQAVLNSLAFAAATMLLVAALGLPLAYALARRSHTSRIGEVLLLLPVGTSAITLGLGFFVAFDRPPLDLRASPLLLPIAHTMIALPFFVRTLLPALRAFDVSLREAAAVEGASAWRIFCSIDMPLLAPTLAAAAVFAFSISLGEFGAALLLARPEFPTVPIAIFRYLGQPGALNYGQAMAMSTLLMLLTMAGALFIERLDSRR